MLIKCVCHDISFKIRNTLINWNINFFSYADLDRYFCKPCRCRSHLDLQSLPVCSWFMADIPIRNDGCVQNQRWKIPFHNIRLNGLKKVHASRHSNNHITWLQHSLVILPPLGVLFASITELAPCTSIMDKGIPSSNAATCATCKRYLLNAVMLILF